MSLRGLRSTGLTLVLAGLIFSMVGTYWGLAKAPAEQYMGQTQRIMYIHVPTAWNALLAFTFAFAASVIFLFTGNWKWDSRAEAAAEAGTVLTFLLCLQGAIWAKPTWGVWWDWDPRLTTSAVLVFAFAGILALRRFVEEPVRRATWSAIAVVIAYIDVPLVYFSVRWWNSLHQQQSSIRSVSSSFRTPLLLNTIGFTLLVLGLIWFRVRVAEARLKRELAPPLEDAALGFEIVSPAMTVQGETR